MAVREEDERVQHGPLTADREHERKEHGRARWRHASAAARVGAWTSTSTPGGHACLERVVRWLDDLEEFDVTAGDGLVTVEFEDGTRFVLNRQSAAKQMWLAAGMRAWHYGGTWRRASWRDDRDGHELFDRLREVVADKLGEPVPPW